MEFFLGFFCGGVSVWDPVGLSMVFFSFGYLRIFSRRFLVIISFHWLPIKIFRNFKKKDPKPALIRGLSSNYKTIFT
jgi:hypothetical protein